MRLDVPFTAVRGLPFRVSEIHLGDPLHACHVRPAALHTRHPSARHMNNAVYPPCGLK
jgi:hypothetical protein